MSLHPANKVSDVNSTTTALGASETFTGGWEKCLFFAGILVLVEADVAGSLYIDWSSDGSTVAHTDTLASNTVVDERGPHAAIVEAPWYRIRLVNGSSAQSSLALTTMLTRDARVTAPYVADNVGLPVRIRNRSTPFNEVITAQSSPIVNLKSIYGLSALRDVQATAGSGSIANSGAEYVLSTTASGTDSATLSSAERGRYVAGQAAEAGIAVRTSTSPTGNQVMRWGYFDAEDGYGFGVDATGIFTFVRKGSSDSKTYQSSWNADTLDGTGDSGLTLTLSDATIFQVVFSWYGYGSIAFEVVTYNPTTKEQVVVIAHRERVTEGVSVADPNLPVRAEIDNAGTAAAGTLYVAGRQFSTYGKFTPSRRVTSQYRLQLGSVGTTFLPTVSFRRKSAFDSVAAKPDAITVLCDADVVVELRQNGSLTGASWITPTNHSAAETALEADISASAISGGEVLFAELIASGGGQASGEATLDITDINLVEQLPVTVCIRRVSGTNATVDVVFRVTEEW